MKRRFLGLSLVAVGVAVFCVVLTGRINRTPFAAGPAWPKGKTAPRLVGCWDQAVLLAPDGTLWGWGGAQFSMGNVLSKPTVTETPQRLSPDSDWVNVAASHAFILAQKADGSLWGWGGNYAGQVSSSPTNRILNPVRIGSDTNWTHISVGMGHVLALKGRGQLWAWGQNDRGQVGNTTTRNETGPVLISDTANWKAISAGAFNSFAIRNDGTVWRWGLDPISGGRSDDLQPMQIDPGTNWTAISAGDYHLAAIQADGTLWVLGQNAHVTAPSFAKASTRNFIQVGADKDWREIYSGQNYFIARKADGSWWGCGANDSGQIGLGFAGGRVGRNVGAPTRLPMDFEPWAFSAGGNTAILLAKDGMLWTWGTRLGAAKRTTPLGVVRRILNETFKRLGVRRSLFNSQDTPCDLTPRKIWQLPEEMKGPQKIPMQPRPE